MEKDAGKEWGGRQHQREERTQKGRKRRGVRERGRTWLRLWRNGAGCNSYRRGAGYVCVRMCADGQRCLRGGDPGVGRGYGCTAAAGAGAGRWHFGGRWGRWPGARVWREEQGWVWMCMASAPPSWHLDGPEGCSLRSCSFLPVLCGRQSLVSRRVPVPGRRLGFHQALLRFVPSRGHRGRRWRWWGRRLKRRVAQVPPEQAAKSDRWPRSPSLHLSLKFPAVCFAFGRESEDERARSGKRGWPGARG